MRILILALTAASLAGCASVTRGTTADVIIDVEPKTAKVVTSLGHTCDTFPCTLSISRKTGFVVSAEAEGFQDAKVEVTTGLSGKGAAGLAGSALLGGIVGVTVDSITGAANDHSPNPVIIKMIPIGGSVAPTTNSITTGAQPKPAPTS